MIPGWKVAREFSRLRQQLRAIPEFFWEPVARRRHDRLLPTTRKITQGLQPASDRIALYLVFQPDEIRASTLETCRYLAEQGFSVLLVANGGLSPASRQALLPDVWQVLERPNFGHDFGGYRDGLFWLRETGALGSELLILNDSVWFPLDHSAAPIARMRALQADVAGSVLRDRSGERFLESYIYLIAERALKDPAFWKFWDELALTANKYKVIRRGERGHSKALIDAGLSVKGAWAEAEFRSTLFAQDNDFLRQTLRYAALLDPALAKANRLLLAEPATPQWRSRVQAHMEKCLLRGQFYSSFPFASVTLLAFPFLKRSRDITAIAWRAAYNDAVAAKDLAPATGLGMKNEIMDQIAL